MTDPKTLVAQAEALEELANDYDGYQSMMVEACATRAQSLRALAALQPVEEQAPRAGELDKQEISSLRWLLNITTEFDRKDIRTRQAARLLDEVFDTKGISNRVHLESLWRKISGLPQARSRQSEQVSEQAALAAAQPGQGEREAFEAWAKPRGFMLDRFIQDPKRGVYIWSGTTEAWEIWQAARTQPPAQPEGWVMVPRELTKAMLVAVHDGPLAADDHNIDHDTRTWLAEMYRAFLAAAPQAPGADKGEAMKALIRKAIYQERARWGDLLGRLSDCTPDFIASNMDWDENDSKNIDALLNPEKE